MSRWVRFVEQHGIVLASAKGPIPAVAEAVAGAPIKGSWWSHPKGKAIFAALSEIDDMTEKCHFLQTNSLHPQLNSRTSDNVLL